MRRRAAWTDLDDSERSLVTEPGSRSYGSRGTGGRPAVAWGWGGQGDMGGEWGLSFRDNENVLELDTGDGKYAKVIESRTLNRGVARHVTQLSL